MPQKRGPEYGSLVSGPESRRPATCCTGSYREQLAMNYFNDEREAPSVDPGRSMRKKIRRHIEIQSQKNQFPVPRSTSQIIRRPLRVALASKITEIKRKHPYVYKKSYQKLCVRLKLVR